METRRINDLASLRDGFVRHQGKFVFRGQTRHYQSPDGTLSINTSFDRKGCVPHAMIKWQHYAKEILRVLELDELNSVEGLPDAILQHYGWRSFYVDVTKSPAVAAWFASHQHADSKPVVEMTEGANEEFVMLVHNAPNYVHAVGEGNIYVVSVEGAAVDGARFVDLTEIEAEGTKLRFITQCGALIGPLSRLAPLAIVERWIVPTDVLREFAAKGGFRKAEDLFPSREDDLFLKLLLAAPWEHIGEDSEIPFYRRGLDIPEYDYRPTRRHLESEGFYRRSFVSREKHLSRSPLLKGAVRFGIGEESFYYHQDNPPLALRALAALLREHAVVIIELDGLIRRPEMHESNEYVKGVAIHRVEGDLVHISEFAARHPGAELTAVRVLAPWTYSMSEEGVLSRRKHEHDCPCNNPKRHEHLFRYVQVFESLLIEQAFQEKTRLEFRHKSCVTL